MAGSLQFIVSKSGSSWEGFALEEIMKEYRTASKECFGGLHRQAQS